MKSGAARAAPAAPLLTVLVNKCTTDNIPTLFEEIWWQARGHFGDKQARGHLIKQGNA